MGIAYPARVPLAQVPTPLQLLPRLSEQFGNGCRLWIKRDDLTGSTLSGNKVRKLEFIAGAAKEQDCSVLITCGGIQSNHCRATALVGAQLGLMVHLLLRGEEPSDSDGNLLLDQLAGAEISFYPPRQYFRELDSLFAHWSEYYLEQGMKSLCVPTGASDGIGLWGYIAGCEELKSDLAREGINGAEIVCATGSGGTQAGLTLGVALHGLDARVWGFNVCDDEAWFLNKVAEDIADWESRYQLTAPASGIETRVVDGYVGPGYGIADPEVFDTIALVARMEGIVLDPVYTGKAFHGMLQEINAGRFNAHKDIVFVHTGGVFGLFPQRDGFQL